MKSEERNGGCEATEVQATESAVTRREVLGTVGKLAAAGAAISLAKPFSALAADPPVKIGILFAKSGAFALQGENLSSGAQLALEQVGSKVLGRPAEIVWYDDATPQDGQQNMEKLIEKDKVCGVVGGSYTSPAAAVAAVAARAKIPFVVANATAPEFTGTKCNRYTFRVSPTIDVTCKAVASEARKLGKRWYFIYPSYAYGVGVYNTIKPLLLAAGGAEIGADAITTGTTDFSSFLLKIRDAKPDAVFSALVGDDFVNFYKQYAEVGLKGKIPIASGASEDSLIWAAGPNAAIGLYAKVWHFSDPQNSAEEKAFVRLYTKKYNRPPSFNNYTGWLSMRLLLAAIERAKSIQAAAIVNGLETLRFGDKNPVYFRPWDHQLLAPVLCLRAKSKITDKWDWLDVVSRFPGRSQDLDQVFGLQKDTLCKMGSI